jgi:hypothetical protein
MLRKIKWRMVFSIMLLFACWLGLVAALLMEGQYLWWFSVTLLALVLNRIEAVMIKLSNMTVEVEP